MFLQRYVKAILLALSLSGFSFAENNGQAFDDDLEYKDWKQQQVDYVTDFDDNIQYWTSFHIMAKRCVVFKDKDVVVFEVFSSGDQCGEHVVGTFYTTVPHYMEGYLAEEAQKMEDRGYDDYVEPDVAKYQYCTPKEVSGKIVYLQLGCADSTTQSIAVNIYKDNTCQHRDTNDYGDDANIDISDIQLPFKKCQSCVNWVNIADDQMDDQFYENRQMSAPLCSTAWSYREKCGRRCKRMGLKEEIEGWKQADITLLVVLIVFGAVMGVLIWRKRQKMSTNDALLEQASMTAAGLQTFHLVAVAVLVVLVIVIFALLGLKNLTLTLILIIVIALFGYLMKLTYDNSVVVGPDGQILQNAPSDDSEDGSRESSVREEVHENNGTYMLPTLT